MSLQQIIPICFLAFSILLLPLSVAVFSKKNPLLKKYIRLCTVFYISGTLLILLIAVFKPSVPLAWVWLCEGFVLGIYAVSCTMVIYITKKFAEGAKPSANQMSDKSDPDQ